MPVIDADHFAGAVGRVPFGQPGPQPQADKARAERKYRDRHGEKQRSQGKYPRPPASRDAPGPCLLERQRH